MELLATRDPELRIATSEITAWEICELMYLSANAFERLMSSGQAGYEPEFAEAFQMLWAAAGSSFGKQSVTERKGRPSCKPVGRVLLRAKTIKAGTMRASTMVRAYGDSLRRCIWYVHMVRAYGTCLWRPSPSGGA